MNILILNYRDIRHPQAGGAEVHLQRIFSRIASWGHRVVLVTTSFPGAPDRETVEGIEVLRFGGDFLFQAQVAFRLRGLCKEFNPDIIVEDLNKLPFYTTLFNNRPKFIQIHHLWRSSIFQEAVFPVAFLVWFQEKLIPWFYKGEAFAAVSPSTVSELEDMGIPNEDIRLIYNGSEDDWGQLESQHEKGKYFLWLGRLRRYKGVWVALEAFRKFAAKVPDVKLIFAGGGPEEKAMREAIIRWKLGDRIEIRGRIPMEEKRDLLRGALALVQSSFKEGWGLTIIEAGVCGTMSIASRVPGLRDSVKDGDTGILVAPGNPSALADAMARVVSKPDERRAMEMSARKFSQGFSWDKAASQTFEALQKTIALRKGSR
jgi:glycosyltransferase involved in cell wall biosynthesis